MNSEGKFDEDIVRAFMSASIPEETLNNAINNCKNEGKIKRNFYLLKYKNKFIK